MDEILFEREEYRVTNAGVAVLLKAILGKLPPPTRKRFAPLDQQQRCLAKEAELIAAGIDAGAMGQWLDLHASQRATGRAWNVVFKALTSLDLLRITYSAAAVSAAMHKVIAMGDPAKCTAPYLAAMLRNASEPRPAAPSASVAPAANMRAALSQEEAWTRIMAVLQQRHPDQRSWSTWLAPCQMIEATPTRLHVSVPSTTHVAWLTDIYTNVFLAAALDVFGEEVKTLQFTSRD